MFCPYLFVLILFLVKGHSKEFNTLKGLLLKTKCTGHWIFSTDLPLNQSFIPLQLRETSIPSTLAHFSPGGPLNPHLTPSFFNREHTPEEMVQPRKFLMQKSLDHCTILIIESGGNAMTLREVTNWFLNSKFVTPNLDIFLYISPYFSEFAGTEFGEDIKAKHGLTPMAINSEDANFFIKSYGCTRIDDKGCRGLLSGAQLKVVTVRGPYFARIHPKIPKSSSGVQFLILKHFSFVYNFTFDLFYSKNGGSGMRSTTPNGTIWNGCIGALFSREADIAMALGITLPRFNVMDPTLAIVIFDRRFFIRTPLPLTDWSSAFKPFDPTLWGLLLTTMVLSLGSFYFFIGGSFRGGQREGVSSLAVLEEILNSQLRILLEQSATLRGWTSGRVRSMVFLWTFFCLVIGIGYRAKLLDYLIFLPPAQIPLSHYELAHSEYKMYFRSYGGVALAELRQSKNPVDALTLRKIHILNSSEVCIINALLEDKSACMDWGPYGEYAIAKNVTLNPFDEFQGKELFRRSLDSNVVPVQIVLGTRKGAPYHHILARETLELYAAGLQTFWDIADQRNTKRLTSKWLKGGGNPSITSAIHKGSTGKGGVGSLTISGLFASFILTLIGSTLGLICFITELFWKKWRQVTR